MFTLKIRWMRYERGEGNLLVTADETTLFVPADEVKVHGIVTSMDQMKSWGSGDFLDYAVRDNDPDAFFSARIIEVNRKNDPTVWYLASHAWVLGPDGQTIERVV